MGYDNNLYWTEAKGGFIVLLEIFVRMSYVVVE